MATVSDVSPDARWVVGVDVGGTKVAAGLVAYESGSEPHVVALHTAPTRAALGGAAVMESIIDAVRDALAEAPAPIEGIGVGTAGCVNPVDGSIASAAEGIMPGWSGMPVAANLKSAFGVPVRVLGDVQAHALGEARWGAAKGCTVCLMVAPGTGLGGGIIVNGAVLRGAHGMAGEIGHTIHPAAVGIACACGEVSHTESVASGSGIASLYRHRIGEADGCDSDIDGAEVSRRAAAGDAIAAAALHDAGYALGQAMGSWANILDPELFILAGSVCKAGPLWRAALDEGYASQALAPVRSVPIVAASLGSTAPIIGAAENLLDALDTEK